MMTSRTARRCVVRSKPQLEQLLGPVGSDWRVHYTTFDRAIGADPGIALTSGEVASWTDQRNGFVVPAVAAGQRPGYSASSGKFFGRSVVKCSLSGARALQGNMGSNVFEIGDRPHIMAVCEFTASLPLSTAVTHRFWELSAGTTTAGQALNANQNSGVTTQSYSGNCSTASVTQSANSSLTNDAITHSTDTVGTTGTHRFGTSVVTATGGAANLVATTRITIGDRRLAGTQPCDGNFAEVLMFRQYIGDLLFARVRKHLRRKWNVLYA